MQFDLFFCVALAGDTSEQGDIDRIKNNLTHCSLFCRLTGMG